MSNLSADEIRAISDFRTLHSTISNLYEGINRGRATYGENVIIELAKLGNVRDSLEKTERIHSWLKHLYIQVCERQIRGEKLEG